MTGLRQDLRYAIRQLRKSPGFAAIAIIILALGIGANTAIFSLLNAVMFRSAPVHDPAHLVALKWTSRKELSFSGYSSFESCFDDATPQDTSDKLVVTNAPAEWDHCSFSYPMFQHIRLQTGVFSDVTAFAGPAQLVVAGNGPATIAQGELVTGEFFRTIGVTAALGRTLGHADDVPTAEPVTVLSYSYWQKAFGGSPSILGKTIRLNGTTLTIIGVADPEFTELSPGRAFDMWLPFSVGERLAIPWFRRGGTPDPENWWVQLVARTKPGVSLGQAQAATSLLFRNEMLNGSSKVGKSAVDPAVVLAPIQQGLVGIRSVFSQPLYVLMAAVALVLLIACANVAGLMLARSSARQREMAVRVTLGAGRVRVLRQLLTESVLLSVMGGMLGVWLAYFGVRALSAFLMAGGLESFQLHVEPDMRVLAFTIAVSLLSGVLFGLAPALRGVRIDLVPALKQSAGNVSLAPSPGCRHFGLGNTLVVAQVALSVVVLVAAGLLVRTLLNLRSIDPGFDTRNLLLFGIDPTLNGYKEPQIDSLYRQLEARLSALPGVVSASYSFDTLLAGGIMRTDVYPDGATERPPLPIDVLDVGPRFFETLRIPLVEGRTFSPADLDSSQPLAVVNRAFVRRYLENRNSLGMRFGNDSKTTKPWEIVGVVNDVKYAGLQDEIRPTAYLPLKGASAYFEVRTSGNPAAMISTVRRIVGELDNNLPLFAVRTQSEQIDQLLFNQRLVARLSSLFGLLALLLASIGLYGLLSYEVARRTREVGLRIALGAQQRDVLRLVIGRGVALVVVGEAIGAGLAMIPTRYLASLLFGVKPIDPPVFAGVVILLAAVALIACYIPARRAAKVDPMVALRYE
jgi:predicted permease